MTLNLSGGYNGDLYGYLTHGDGFIVLLNRVGQGTGSEPIYSFGYGNTGFDVTLSDAGANGIQNYQEYSYSLNGSGQLTGTWKPNTGGASFASEFNGLNPNGSWTLFFADLAGGDTSTLTGFSVNISAVPEPPTWALGIFALLAGGVQLARRWRCGRHET